MAARKSEKAVTSAQMDSVADSVAEFSATEHTETSTRLYMPSGLTTLNLALTDQPDAAFPVGTMCNLCGGSSSGKTVLIKTALAEACYRPEFDEYDLIYDDGEEADQFDNRKLFGPRYVERVMPPAFRPDGSPAFSHTVEEFYSNLVRRLRSPKPFIYVLDSVDSLSDANELDSAISMQEKHDKELTNVEGEAVGSGAEQKGSYKMQKAKLFSEILRVAVGGLAQKKSILILISQVRDKVGGMVPGQLTRAGGRALKFYATHEIWMTHMQDIKKTVAGQQYKVGDVSKFKVSKNKVTGKCRECLGTIFYDYGVDDIGTTLDYLIAVGAVPKKSASSFEMDEPFNISGQKDTLARKIEESDELRKALKETAGGVWQGIEDSLKLGRKSRFE